MTTLDSSRAAGALDDDIRQTAGLMPPLAVERYAVHRTTEAEVLIPGIERIDGPRWRAELAIPRSHWLCHPVPDRVPLTLLAEAFRQSGLAVCVLGLGADPDLHFAIAEMTVELTGPAPRFPRFGAYEAVLLLTFVDMTYRKGMLHRLEVDYEVAGVVSGHVSAQALRDRDYRAVRRNASVLDDDIKSRSHELLGRTSRTGHDVTAVLGVDEADPFFFDHPVDHLPGMLLFHAAALMHERETGMHATGITIGFPSFAELRDEVSIRTRISGTSSRTVFGQNGSPVADAVVASSGVMGVPA